MKGLDAVAHVYAEALIELAYEKGVPGEVLRDLLEVDKVLEDPQVMLFLEAPNIQRTKKIAVIDRALGGRVSDIVHNFLRVLIEKGRGETLRAVIQAFVAKHRERQGELLVQLRSAYPLEDAERDHLRTALKRRHEGTYTDFVFEERVDPTLLGGLVLRAGDNLYDATIRTRLDAVGELLRASRLKNEEIYEDQG